MTGRLPTGNAKTPSIGHLFEFLLRAFSSLGEDFSFSSATLRRMEQPADKPIPSEGAPSSVGGATPAGPTREPTERERSQQLEFLYRALDDNQNVIRFLDAKAAFAVALLSAMAGKVLSNLGAYFPWGEQPFLRQLLVLGFGFLAAIAAHLVAKTVFPTTNPARNTRLLQNIPPQFFLWELSPRSWRRILLNDPRFARLAQEHGAYLDAVSAADSTVLLRVVSAEVLKVSYIRQIKMDRLKALGYVLLACAVLFVALMITEAVPKPINPLPVQLHGPVTLNPPVTSVMAPSQSAAHRTEGSSSQLGANRAARNDRASPAKAGRPTQPRIGKAP